MMQYLKNPGVRGLIFLLVIVGGIWYRVFLVEHKMLEEISPSSLVCLKQRAADKQVECRTGISPNREQEFIAELSTMRVLLFTMYSILGIAGFSILLVVLGLVKLDSQPQQKK